jgi:hypothetical protein
MAGPGKQSLSVAATDRGPAYIGPGYRAAYIRTTPTNGNLE